MLAPGAISGGGINQVDGFVATEGDSEVLRAAMILLAEDEEDDDRSQVTGTIGVIDSESLTLLTDEGDICVAFEEGDTAVFESADDGGVLVFSEQTLDSLVSGQRIDAFGEMSEEGCLEADTIIYQGGRSLNLHAEVH